MAKLANVTFTNIGSPPEHAVEREVIERHRALRTLCGWHGAWVETGPDMLYVSGAAIAAVEELSDHSVNDCVRRSTR